MRNQSKLISRSKLLAAVLAVNGFAFYAAAQDASTPSDSSSAPVNATHDVSQGSVVPHSGRVVPTKTNTAANNNANNTANGAVNSGAANSSNGVFGTAGSTNVNGNAVGGTANNGSTNNTGVVNPNVNPNDVNNVNGQNANTAAGGITNADGTTTINNGATVDTSTRGTARGTLNANGTVNNGTPGATNSAGAGAANSAGVGAANTAGVGAGNTAGVGAANSAGVGAGNSAGVGAGNSAGIGAANSAGVGAANSAGVGASSATDNAQPAASSSGSTSTPITDAPGAFNNSGATGTSGAFNNSGTNGGAANVTPNTANNGATTENGTRNTTSGNTNSGSTTGGAKSGGAAGAGHVDASSAIDQPVYLDDLSTYSRSKPNKDTPTDSPAAHSDEAIPAGSTINSDNSLKSGATVRSTSEKSSDNSRISGQTLSATADSGQVRQVLAQTTEAALSKDSCEKLASNFDKMDRSRLDLSSAKFDDLNVKIDQFNQDWREKYGRDFTIRQPEVVFNDEYRFMPGGVSTETARTAGDRITPSNDSSARSDFQADPRVKYRTTTSEQSTPVGSFGDARVSSPTRVSTHVNTRSTETTVSSQSSVSATPTGQVLPADATYHDGTKMKADGTIQRNDITTANARPGQINVPTGNTINDRDSANKDRPDQNTAAIQRDVIDASAQQANARVEHAYTDTTVHTDAVASSNSVNLHPGESAEIDSHSGAVRRDVAGDGVLLRTPASDNSQAASDVQTVSVERALVIVPASHGLQQLSVPMIKEDGAWKICIPDNADGQKLHDSLMRHITAMDDQKATWPTDVNDATRMANHHILAAIYEPQKGAAIDASAAK